MLAIQVMLSIYAMAMVVAVLYGVIWPRFQDWLIRHGARDPQWLYLNYEPPGFKVLYRQKTKKDDA
jgi:hypothetical protein